MSGGRQETFQRRLSIFQNIVKVYPCLVKNNLLLPCLVDFKTFILTRYIWVIAGVITMISVIFGFWSECCPVRFKTQFYVLKRDLQSNLEWQYFTNTESIAALWFDGQTEGLHPVWRASCSQREKECVHCTVEWGEETWGYQEQTSLHLWWRVCGDLQRLNSLL